jgi:ribosomal protein S14
LTSDRKISSNRKNARGSTGPKTAQARVRAARNALRHALSVSVYSDPALSEEVEVLAREIAGSEANAEIQELAHQIAEAQIDLRCVRCARHQFLTRTLAEPYYDSRANAREKMAMLGRLLGKDPPDVPLDALVSVVTSTPQGPHKLATILSQEAKQLLAMDRYERRALSRRKFAIRAFDAARR